MKERGLRLIILTFVLMLVMALPALAEDHWIGTSSVDEGEIRWGGDNWYSGNRNDAIAKWNDLNPINILPDEWWTVEDVNFYDVYYTDVIWAGQWVHSNGTDDIVINNYRMDQLGDNTLLTAVFIHEIGHALGLDDHYGSAYTRWGSNPSVMYNDLNFATDIQSHDVDDYNHLWN